jgi:BirA family biotin operon repressor/biotin-[acetyl-CoA-carboxylase] ligase
VRAVLEDAEARRERVLAALVEAGPGGLSGPDLARRLGCARASVHRHVAALRRTGLPVEAAGAGYRLGPGWDPVVPALLAPRLEPPILGPVRWRAETGSTNDDVVREARAGAHEGLVIGADHQRAGRGRRGRAWEAAPGDALLVSVLLRPPVAPVEAGALAIVVAVAVADALAALTPAPVSLVWPNDVLVGGRKAAGVLIELSADQERVTWAVAGVGVNVRSAPPLAGARWTPGALAEHGPPPARADLLAAMLTSLSRRYAAWVRSGPAEALAAFAGRDDLAGRRVRLALADGEMTGQALGLDEMGRLRVAVRGVERALAAGEVVGVDDAEGEG